MRSGSSKRKDKHTRETNLVLTPGGWRPKSKVFKVEPGHHVEVQEGRLKVIHTATGRIIADVGPGPITDTENSNASRSRAGLGRKIKKPRKGGR
jgi:hypothetical protein